MRSFTGLLLLAISFIGLSACGQDDETPPVSIILATTTSVRDTRLLDTILPAFTEASGVEVRVIAVGTGAALRMGREGNADVLLTHAPASEEALVEEGIVHSRTPFMENYFVIAGPADDPAGVSGASSPEEALQRIAATNAPFVSRNDDSGTHKREVELIRAAGLDPNEGPGDAVLRTGSGMGQSLQVAGERRAYILSDIGTFLAFQPKVGLKILSGQSAALRNVYSVLQLDPSRQRNEAVGQAAEAFERYLLSPGVQRTLAGFGRERFGRPLFVPLHLDAVPAD
jgi:tungstate transport system substrate-binding protein